MHLCRAETTVASNTIFLTNYNDKIEEISQVWTSSVGQYIP
jgi:hypothetical protein